MGGGACSSPGAVVCVWVMVTVGFMEEVTQATWRDRPIGFIGGPGGGSSPLFILPVGCGGGPSVDLGYPDLACGCVPTQKSYEEETIQML